MMLNGAWISRTDVESRLDSILCIQHRQNTGKKRKKRAKELDRQFWKFNFLALFLCRTTFQWRVETLKLQGIQGRTWSWGNTLIRAFEHAPMGFRCADHDCKSCTPQRNRKRKSRRVQRQRMRNVVPQGSPLPVGWGNPLRFRTGLNRSSLKSPIVGLPGSP